MVNMFFLHKLKASDENGGPYCEISDLILCVIGSAVFDEIF